VKGNTHSCPLAGPLLVLHTAVLEVVLDVVVVVVEVVVVVVELDDPVVVDVVVVVVVVGVTGDVVVVVVVVLVVLVVVVVVVVVVPVTGQEDGQKPYWLSWNSPAWSTLVAHQAAALSTAVQLV